MPLVQDMKSIRTKFLVAVGTVVIVFCGFISWGSWQSTHQHIEELTAGKAELALQFDLAIRRYIGDTVRPLMEAAYREGRVHPRGDVHIVCRPQRVRAGRKGVPGLHHQVLVRQSPESGECRWAGRNETHPVFSGQPHGHEVVWPFQMNGRSYFVHCIPRRMEASCLRCHGRPEDAPASLVSRYGSKAGFYRSAGDVIALDTVGIPMDNVNANIASKSRTQLAILSIGVAAYFWELWCSSSAISSAAV